MTYVIGVDVGGTFTDAVAVRGDGALVTAKTPSTPPDFDDGVVNAIDLLAHSLGTSTRELLKETAHVAHGTTSTLNALVTGDVATVGFITTKGHRDSIYIMNVEGRYLGLGPHEVQDILHTSKPSPLVPKRRAVEVTERIDSQGAVVVPLDEEDATGVITRLIGDGVDAIAISLLWSFRNPVHELRLRELVHAVSPDTYVTLSSELTPRIREFARNATTIMSTQVGPALRTYLEALDGRLKSNGLDGPLLVMQSSGGTISAPEAPGSAITTVGSVLTGGLTGALRLGEELGHRNIISTDVGGTTFLVGLIADGEPVRSTTTIINQHPINVPSLKVHVIGSGGGAIVRIDAGKNLRVGPRSVGARPGPACYGEGGELPTVTDADLVLGILNERYFLGGQKPLSTERAERAIERQVAAPLGLDTAEAAAAIFAVQNAQTADLARKVVVDAGHDPRDFVMYAFGGAGPVHAFAYGSDLGVAEVVVPLGAAAAFSAYGLAASDLVLTRELSDPANFPLDPERVNANFAALEARVMAAIDAQGVPTARIELRREIDIRYSLQLAEVATSVPGSVIDAAGVDLIACLFESRYERLFGVGSGFREAGFQAMTYRIIGTGHLPSVSRLPGASAVTGRQADEALRERRKVLLDPDLGFRETAVYAYDRLLPGHTFQGPAIVEAPTTTVVVPDGAEARVDRFRNVSILFGGS